MMIYDKKKDVLRNNSAWIKKEGNTFFYSEGNFYYVQNNFICTLYMIKNAHKYVQCNILEEMTKENDYIILTSRELMLGDYGLTPSIIRNPSYKYFVKVYKRVINVVPRVTVDYIELGSSDEL